MTLEDLYLTVLAVFPGKVAYNAFPENQAPEMPYMIINETSSDNFGADNRVYFKRKNVDIELYTKTKDAATETLLENALDAAHIFYESSDTYISDEKCFERIYSIEV